MPKRKKVKRKSKTIGRPCKYLSEYDQEAKDLCLLGYTDVQLAENFHIVESTLNEWKKKFPSFSASIKAGKQVADIQVVNALHRRATGFRYDEVTYEKMVSEVDGESDDDDIKLEINKKKVVTKEVVPDASAAQFWLKNRQPKMWRDKTEATVTNINSAPLTKEEIREYSKALEDDC